MSRTAMGIDHLSETGMPDVSNPGGANVGVPVGPAIGQWAQAPLGFIHSEPASQVPFSWVPGDPLPALMSGAGGQEWMYIYNPLDGAPLAAGEAVKRAAIPTAGFLAAFTEQSDAVGTTANASLIMGVAQYPIQAGFFGFILVKGPGIADLGGGAINGGRALIPGAAGELAEAGPADVVNACGVSCAQAGALATAPVLLNCTG